MDNKLSGHLNQLKAIRRQRKYWLLLSVMVVGFITYIISDWNQLSQDRIYFYLVISSGLGIAIVWWYWTMNVMKTLIQHRSEELEILNDLVVDIKDIKQHVKDVLTK